MISYTRNFEDVMIGRALKHIENGFYLDIGAFQPVLDSNTYALYQRGWRGIVAEPQDVFNAIWQRDRPDDALVNAAIGAFDGELTLYKPVQYGQAATTNPDYAQDYQNRGLEMQAWRVQQLTLNTLLAAAAEQGRFQGEIHLLSVDVEGAEREVILGLDWTRFRPWLVVLESTLPGVPTPNYEGWEQLLLDQGYEFAYFDAVNRFYVAKERAELKAAFATPPCVWDEFVAHEVVALRDENAALHQQIAALTQEKEQLKQQTSFFHGRLNAAAELLLATSKKINNPDEPLLYEDLLWRINEALPEFEALHWVIGGHLVGLDRREEALAFYQRTAELFPTNRYPPNNLGLLHRWAKRWPESEAAFRRALELDPGFSECRMNLGALLLALGRYAEGWEAFEARYLVQPHETPRMSHNAPYERWTGQPLAGKAIIVLREQGYGDSIMFARFVQTLKNKGAARVSILCQMAIRTLLETTPGVDAVVCAEDLEAWPAHDYWIYEQSLPHALGITLDNLPAPIPYLFAKEEARLAWRKRIQGLNPSKAKTKIKKLNVGLTWRGSALHGNDRHRSLPDLSPLRPLWDVPGIQFISLQTAEAAAQADPAPATQPMAAWGPEMGDFAGGAALVNELDLIITVDTAIAHLAGALGVPCWVLIPVVETDWRWLTDRDDSPWYPVGMKIYRQTVDYEWGDVVEKITADLAAYASAGH